MMSTYLGGLEVLLLLAQARGCLCSSRASVCVPLGVRRHGSLCSQERGGVSVSDVAAELDSCHIGRLGVLGLCEGGQVTLFAAE